MKLVAVTPQTLTDEHIKTAEMMELTGRVYYQMRHEKAFTEEHYKVQWEEGLHSLAALINAEREVGVRAVVEVLRELRSVRHDFSFASYVGSTYLAGEARKRLAEAEAAADELLALYPHPR
jgi:hypothetical protein